MHVNTNKIGSALVQTYKIYEQKSFTANFVITFRAESRLGFLSCVLRFINCKPSSHQRLVASLPRPTTSSVFVLYIFPKSRKRDELAR